MDNFASIINEAAEITAEQKVKEAKFDATIQAKIQSCEDQSRGKYRVKYQDSVFIAYAEKDSTYTKDTDVYILVPSNDFSKTKKIIGSVNNLPTDYVSIVAGTEESFDKIGVDIIDDSNEFALKSALSYDLNRNSITLYDAGQDKSKNLISVNEKVAMEYMSKAEYFIMAASFRTNLQESQKSNGVYIYRIKIQFEDRASGNIKYRDYELSSLEMAGQPYNFIDKARQFKVYQYTDFKYMSISKVEFLCNDFPQGEELDDLLISDLEFYAAKPIPQEDLTSYHISLSTSQGSIFIENTATKELPIDAIFKIDGKAVDSSTIDFLWFLQDNTIGTESERYHSKGGIGWRCVNDYRDIIDDDGNKVGKDWISRGISRYKVQKIDLPVEYSTFKCVVVYDDKSTIAYQEIINRDHNYSVKIECDQIVDGKISWYNDEGKADLKCVTKRSDTEITTNLNYVWSKQDAYGNTVPINPEVDPKDYDRWVDYVLKADEYVANNPGVFFREQYPKYDEYKAKIAAYEDQTRIEGQWLRNVRAIDIDTLATYTVTVTYTNLDTGKVMVIGTDKVIITNGKSSGGYIVNIEKPPLYKYNANGISPASDSQGSQKITIEPLKFILIDANGNVLPDSSIVSNFNIKWTLPAQQTMILAGADPAAVLSEDETEYTVLNKTQVIYNIAETFSIGKTNNTVILEITNKEDSSIYLRNIITLLFTKEGGMGTNGTEYNITLSLIGNEVSNYTDRVDIPIVKIKNYKISPSLSPMNFVTENSKWLKFTFWKNGDKIFEGVNSNTMPGYEGLQTVEGKEISSLTWQMLSSKSYYYVTEDGRFSSSNNFNLNPCNIVKLSFYYDGLYYSSCLPIATILVDEEDYLSAPQKGGFIEVTYGADGTNPFYSTTDPFIIKAFKDDVEITEELEYKWDFAGDISNMSWEKVSNEKPNERWVKPNAKLESTAMDNAIVTYIGEKEWYSDEAWQIDHPMEEMSSDEALIYDEFLILVNEIQENEEYTEDEKEEMIQAQVQLYKKALPFYLHIYNTVHFPIHMLTNRYNFAAINEWDGNVYTLNEDNDVLLIPQIGAGRKEKDNSFTGMLMGTIEVKKKSTCDVGLFGYNSGERTFFLDGKTGKIELGVKSSKIIIDPTSKTGAASAMISANYSKTQKTGMLIDLIEPSITFGNGMFSVDSEGHLVAQNAEVSGRINAEELNADGCDIGNFEISKSALMMDVDKSYKELYYDWETHEWDFNKVFENEETGEPIPIDSEIVYKRMKASADIYFGKLGLNIGKVDENNNTSNFLVKKDGSMFCKQATISDALFISSHSIKSNEILVEEGGSIKYANELFKVNKEGKAYIDELECRVLKAEAINPEGEVSKVLVGTDLTLSVGSKTYFKIDSTRINAGELHFTGKTIECDNINLHNNCTLSSDGLITARQLDIDTLVTNSINIHSSDYIFTSDDSVSIYGKELGNVSIQRGKILSFTNDVIGSDLDMVPKIIGWVPIDQSKDIIYDEEPCLELDSGHKILLNSQYVDIQTAGNGKVSFLHNGISEETGEDIIEKYAELSVEGLKLHEGGDTLVSMLDGTYNIPYPPNQQYYDKIFSLDGCIFKSIYVQDPSEAQGIDLTSAFGGINPDDISVQLCISINLKGVVTSISEIEEEENYSNDEGEENTKMIRNFYINYNRIPTKEEFGEDAIKMHWSAFFFKKN